MSEHRRLFDVFLDVQRGLPRQGPGCRESTLQALALCGALPEQPAVLDIGCGPGVQSVVLAAACEGHVTAVDNNEYYLSQLKERAEVTGVADRIEVVNADMNALPFGPGGFDLVWSEAAAYIMGIEAALLAWKRLLEPGGFVAFSELVWLRNDPPREVAEFFGSEYPPMTDVATNAETVRRCGYELAGHFTLPDSAWWDDYYTPLEAKLPALFGKYAEDAEALVVVEAAEREIEMRRRFGDSYGYEFFVGRLST
jgi:ubiquinone/menaquinone biosynthesis C-methylase UbiE